MSETEDNPTAEADVLDMPRREPVEESGFSSEEWHAIRTTIANNGLQPATLAIYSRWWQLETWLRELSYVELRARYGIDWESKVASAAGRQRQDAAFTHMRNADSENPLAYLDYSQLLKVIEADWDLFETALIEKTSWAGRQVDLQRVRHRLGHMRQPHQDDLNRLEQVLRDLEQGTFISLASYNNRWNPSAVAKRGIVLHDWIDGNHPTAQRLIDHAERRYDIALSLQVSRRPWATYPEDLDAAAGVLWHAQFYVGGERGIDLPSVWREQYVRRIRPLLVHVLSDNPHQIEFTFAAADDPKRISDAIGDVFDGVISAARGSRSDIAEESWDSRGRRARITDFRVLAGTGWNIVDDSTVPITSFGAGSRIEEPPIW